MESEDENEPYALDEQRFYGSSHSPPRFLKHL